MTAATITLLTQKLLFGPTPRLTDAGRADFAEELTKAAPTTRSNGVEQRTNDANTKTEQDDPKKNATTDTTSEQAEPASSDAGSDGTQEPGTDAAAQTGTEGDASVSQQSIGGATAAKTNIINKDRAGIVSGRAKDLRERTEHEFYGRTDVAQLAAQELSAGPNAAQSVQPPQPIAQEAKAGVERSVEQGARAGQSAEGQSSQAQPQRSQARQSETPAPPQGSAAKAPTSAVTSPDKHGTGDSHNPGSSPQDSGAPSPGSTTATQVSANAGQAIAGSASVEPQAIKPEVAPGVTGKEVAAVGAARSTGQLLKRLERNTPTLTLAKADTPTKGEGAIPAAALRGLAAALRQGGGTVTLRLNPETLGSLKVQVSTQDAKIVAKFQASSDQARQLLTDNVESLRSAMESRGLNVDRIVIEHPPGWMPQGSQDHHDAKAGGAGTQDSQNPPWNGGGPGSHSGQGQDGHNAGDFGQGRPQPHAQALRGVGAETQVATAEPAGAVNADAFTDERGPEQLITLRLDAVA